MFWLVVETFVLVAVFVALGVVVGIALRQLFGRPEPALGYAGAGVPNAPPAPGAGGVDTPVVVPVTHSDAADLVVPLVEPIAPEEAPEEAPALAGLAPDAASSDRDGGAASMATLTAADAVIDPGRAAAADQVGARPGALAGPRDGQGDDLKLIKGIGPQNEARLNALGIFHFDQIAGWTPEESRWVGSYLAFPGRIEREDWIGQARRLAAG